MVNRVQSGKDFYERKSILNKFIVFSLKYLTLKNLTKMFKLGINFTRYSLINEFKLSQKNFKMTFLS